MLEWIVSSTILIVILIIIRTIFKSKISLTLQYALWGIVLVRLLLPFSIGSTLISVANLRETAKQQPAVQTVIEMGSVSVSTQSYEDAYHQVAQEYQSNGIDVDTLEGEALDAMESEIQTAMKGKTVAEILFDVLIYIWIAGIIAVGGLFLYTNIRFRKKLRDARTDSGIRKGNITVWLSPDLDTPCLFGVLETGIYISKSVLDDPIRLRHILEHEQTHYRHGDHIWSVLRGVCLALHWYNPLVWCAAFLSQRDAELACDEATIKRLGESERAEYGRTLINMTCRKKTNVLTTATTMNASKKGIKERIQLIAKKPKMAVFTLIVVILIAAIAISCTFTGAKDTLSQEPLSDEQIEDFFLTYDGEGRPTAGSYEVKFIGSTEEYALVYYSGTGNKLVLYRYKYADGQISVLSATEGAYKLGKGITMNHLALEKGHLYFGTVADSRGVWESLVLIDKDGKEYSRELRDKTGFVCVLDAPLSDFRVMNSNGSVATDMADYLSRNKIVEVSFNKPPVLPTKPEETTVPVETTKPTESTVPAETTEPAEAVRTWPYEDADGFDNQYPSVFTIDGSDIGPLYKNKVYGLISLGLNTTLSGEAYVYVIPDNQEEIIAAFKKAYTEGETVKSVSNFASGFAINYQGDTWFILGDGSVYMHDNGKYNILPPEASADLVALCEATLRKVGIPEAVGPEDITRIRSATLRWNGIHTLTDTESLQFIQSLLSNSQDLGYGAGCPFGALLTLEMTNGKTVTVTMATDDCDVWMSEGKFYTFYPQDGSDNDGNRPFYQLFAMSALHYVAGGHMDNIQYLMGYLDWDQYAKTYGDQEVRYFMNQMKAWIKENYDERISYALWRLPDLDGAYSEVYAAMLTQLYDENPAFFAKTCLNTLYNEFQENVLRLLGQYWNMNINEVRGKLREAISNPKY